MKITVQIDKIKRSVTIKDKDPEYIYQMARLLAKQCARETEKKMNKKNPLT